MPVVATAEVDIRARVDDFDRESFRRAVFSSSKRGTRKGELVVAPPTRPNPLEGAPR
jgi:hypothetical protein